jgi:hypothetical protein
VLSPHVTGKARAHPNDPFGLFGDGLILHAPQRQLSGVVGTLRQYGHLDILPGLSERLADALMGQVVDARTEDRDTGM